MNSHYGVGVDAGAALTLFPFGHWTFDLFDNFIRTSDTPGSVVKQAFVNEQGQNINIDQNQFGMKLHWHPGGQRFETTLQYMLRLYAFESGLFQSKSNLVNDFNLRFNWNFFPKTAIFVEASEQAYTYFNYSGVNTPPAAYPFRVLAGLVGLITPKLTLNLSGGYGNSFSQSNAHYMNVASYSGPLATVELAWKPFSLTSLALGYHHDFAQGIIGTYYEDDSGYILFTSRFGSSSGRCDSRSRTDATSAR